MAERQTPSPEFSDAQKKAVEKMIAQAVAGAEQRLTKARTARGVALNAPARSVNHGHAATADGIFEAADWDEYLRGLRSEEFSVDDVDTRIEQLSERLTELRSPANKRRMKGVIGAAMAIREDVATRPAGKTK